MKRFLNIGVIFCSLFVLVFTFVGQELHISKIEKTSSYIPAEFLQVTLGYVTELAAGIIFAQSAVFIGNRKTNLGNTANLDSLANSLAVTAQLYPELIDTYFLCEAALPPASVEYSRKANLILDFGIKSLPDNLILPFYKGVNLFYYMKEPLAAAKIFSVISSKPDAPPLFGHLAAVLAAEGGDWQAGIISLQLMLELEDDEITRQLYQDEIYAMDEAIFVQKAIDSYIRDNATPPPSLEALVPTYIDMVPLSHTSFHFVYDPPKLKLIRPVLGRQ